MYDHFDDFIKTFGSENASEDYWYDVALFESIETVNKFNENDWEKVMQNISSKSKIWKIRLLESFGIYRRSYLNIIVLFFPPHLVRLLP